MMDPQARVIIGEALHKLETFGTSQYSDVDPNLTLAQAVYLHETRNKLRLVLGLEPESNR